MKRKVCTRIWSVLLAAAMLASLMPAAFAANRDYGTLSMYAGSNEEYFLINDGDFDYEDLYGKADYFVIYNDDDGPAVRSDVNDRNVEGKKLWYDAYANEYDIVDVYFDTGDYDYAGKAYEYTIYGYDADDYMIGYMTLLLYVDSDGSPAGDIRYSTAYNTPVSFVGSDFEGLLSSGQTLSYVTFTPPSSKTVGTLALGQGGLTAITANTQVSLADLDDVSFTPKSGVSGNVSIAFNLHYKTASGSARSFSGTVVVSIDDGTTVSYTGETDGKVAFDSADFDDVCYAMTGQSLEYVRFSLPASSKGTLYAVYDSVSWGGITAKSATKFYVNPANDAYALDDVVFVPAASGMTEFGYTAYDSNGKSFTGKVKITVADGVLSPIHYTVSGKSVSFSADSFVAALKEKTSRTLSSVTFTLPKSTEGTLYDNGSTKVSASTQYKASGSVNTLDQVSFVPASGAPESVTISYTAKDSSGRNYAGTVVVKTFAGQDTVITYTTTGRAAVFSAADFTNACAQKLGTTLSYVQFVLPSASQGTLYYGYGTSQQTRVSANAKYMVGTHLPYVSFLPRAGFSGTATISYTGYDTTGGFYIGTIQVVVTPPAKSVYFTDADQSWIAPAADFLQANNVYTGVVSGTTLGLGTSVTRGEVMQMIYNAFNLKNKVPTVTSNFTDVPATHPCYTAINAGYALGIAQGQGGGKFNPDALITREDACTLLYRAFSTLGLNMTTGTADDMKSFGDYAKVSDYAASAVAGMIKSSIIQGDQNGNISPKSNLNRGEISVILHRAMTL